MLAGQSLPLEAGTAVGLAGIGESMGRDMEFTQGQVGESQLVAVLGDEGELVRQLEIGRAMQRERALRQLTGVNRKRRPGTSGVACSPAPASDQG